MEGERLEACFEIALISARDIWDGVIANTLRSMNWSSVPILLNDHEVDLETGSNLISTKRGTHFEVKLGNFEIIFNLIPNFDHSILVIKETESQEKQWNTWAESCIRLPGFVQAWVSNNEYYYWQNASDLLQYEAENKSAEGLTLVSNGLPEPLEQKIVDISNNPCRRELRSGYIEAIGCPMWLGESFWHKAATSKEAVIARLDGKCSIMNGVLRIDATNLPFSSRQTKSLQVDLRNVLFGSR